MLHHGKRLAIIHAMACACSFWFASGLLGGFHVTGFWAAVLGALLYSILGLIVDALITRLFPK